MSSKRKTTPSKRQSEDFIVSGDEDQSTTYDENQCTTYDENQSRGYGGCNDSGSDGFSPARSEASSPSFDEFDSEEQETIREPSDKIPRNDQHHLNQLVCLTRDDAVSSTDAKAARVQQALRTQNWDEEEKQRLSRASHDSHADGMNTEGFVRQFDEMIEHLINSRISLEDKLLAVSRISSQCQALEKVLYQTSIGEVSFLFLFKTHLN